MRLLFYTTFQMAVDDSEQREVEYCNSSKHSHVANLNFNSDWQGTDFGPAACMSNYIQPTISNKPLNHLSNPTTTVPRHCKSPAAPTAPPDCPIPSPKYPSTQHTARDFRTTPHSPHFPPQRTNTLASALSDIPTPSTHLRQHEQIHASPQSPVSTVYSLQSPQREATSEI